MKKNMENMILTKYKIKYSGAIIAFSGFSDCRITKDTVFQYVLN